MKKGFSRRDFLKVAGALAASSILPACVPEPAPTLVIPQVTHTEPAVTILPPASATPSDTPTPSRTPAPPTSTLLPRSSPKLVDTETPEASPADILTPVQQQRVYEASLKYIAENEASAIQVARSLGYIHGDGHPASVCGPLAAAILREAGLIDPYINLHDFWLLDPRPSQNLQVVLRVFPTDEFTWFQTDQPTNRFDFRQFPWKVGDFIYLYAGKSGTFEHMFTISKVDEKGRPYTVTNFNTPAGFVIEEVMLYDLEQPGVGKLYEWTDRQYIKYGLTGFGGFSVWRFKVPVRDAGVLEQKLAVDIDTIVDQAGGDWHILVQEVGGSRIYTRLSRDELHPASVIKIPIAALFLKSIEKNLSVSPSAILEEGIDGRSFQQLLRSMVVDSEEPATDSLLLALEGSKFDIPKTLESWNIHNTDIFDRRSTVRDMEVLFEGVYSGHFLGQAGQGILLDLMSIFTPNDDTRLGVLRHLLPDGYHFYNKRGTITADFLVAADSALLTFSTAQGNKAFFMGVFGYQGQKITTYEKLDQAIRDIAFVFWAYARQL